MDSTATAPDLVVVGSANADVVVRVERLPGPGETVRGSEARIHLLALGVRSAVVTLGAEGAVVADARGSVRLAAPAVEAVDSTGAGDAFTGALAWRLGAGDDLATAARFAVRVGAASVTGHGAQSSYPSPEEPAAF